MGGRLMQLLAYGAQDCYYDTLTNEQSVKLTLQFPTVEHKLSMLYGKCDENYMHFSDTSDTIYTWDVHNCIWL